MAEARATPSVARPQVLLGAALVVAAAQIALGARLEYDDDYQLTLAIGWLGALFLAWEGRATQAGSPGLGPTVAGALIALGSVAAMVAVPGYRSFFRLLPLVGSAGLALAASGKSAWAHHRGSLLLLALPVVNPPAKLLHSVLDPVLIPMTTWCALGLNRAAGHAMIADGHVLRMAHASLEVVDGCSGLWAMTRLAVLAALVVALFPTTNRQRLALLASVFVVGFCLNAVRVAILATIMLHRDDAGFAYWHQGTGATFSALASSAIAGFAWWLMLRRGRGAPEAVSPAPIDDVT